RSAQGRHRAAVRAHHADPRLVRRARLRGSRRVRVAGAEAGAVQLSAQLQSHDQASGSTMTNKRRYSSLVVDGPKQAAPRAMLYATGFKEEDCGKPQFGIASTWSNLTPCNMHIDQLAEAAAMGAEEAGGKSIVLNTITVSDGISMGSPGMRYSLVSRE